MGGGGWKDVRGGGLRVLVVLGLGLMIACRLILGVKPPPGMLNT